MKKLIIILGIILILPLLMYIINPFGTASLDPRARIAGYIPFRIPASAMKPTLKKDDYILVSSFAYMFDEPKINDLIAFKYPKNRNVNYIKRVVALGGNDISLVKGKVVVNGKEINQSYVNSKNTLKTNKKSIGPWHVPEGMVFVLGDNRDNSNDSRYWGFVPTVDIIGKVVLIWPAE
jgi:signal peptidase I